MRAVLLFLLFLFLLQAIPDNAFSEEEDLNLCHHVDVISGHLSLYFQDAAVKGAVPLSIDRAYSSAVASERDHAFEGVCDNWLIQGGWSFLSHLYLLFSPGKIANTHFYLFEKNGTLIKYVFDHSEGQYYHKNYLAIYKPEISAGQCSGILNARVHPKNNRLHYFPNKKRAILNLPDGGSRIYEGEFDDYFTGIPLKEEITPHQHRIGYKHNKHNDQVTISTTNSTKTKVFSSIQLTMLRQPGMKHRFHYRANTSDGKELHYRSVVYKDRHYLNDVKGNCRPNEAVHFLPGGGGARMEYLVLDDHLQFKVRYYEREEKKRDSRDKVKTLLGPMGANGECIPIAEFSYTQTQTDVRDVENILTRYRHDGDKLLEIHYFNRLSELDSLVRFTWDESLLKAKTYLKTPKEALFSKTFQHDASGNVIEEVIWGNLTGNAPQSFSLDANGHLIGAESYKKRFAYLPKFNVPTLEEEEAGLTYKYFYKPDTNLLVAKLTCDREKILIRQFFAYNTDHLLIQEITDDGTSENHLDLTHVTERRYKRYILDAASGLVTSCTESYFDVHTEKEQILKRIDYTYSPQKRAIAERVHDANGAYRYTIHTDYDSRGHIILKTTAVGQRNTYVYDTFGTLLESKEVGAPKKVYTHQESKRILYNTDDANTHTVYNALNKPIHVHYPDGSVVHHIYHIDGTLAKTVSPDLTEVHYTYDPLKRMTSKRCFSSDGELLAEELWEFNAFHLLSHTDENGLKTTYEYDGAGRKIAEYAEDRAHYFSYDALGFLERTTDGTLTLIEIHDEAGRIIEKYTEDTEERIENRMQFFYDEENRKIKTTRVTSQGLATDHFAYDSQGHLYQHQDPLGNITQYIYSDTQKITIDPPEAIAKLLYPEKSMIFRPFESGSQAATAHPTKSTPSGSIEEEGLKGPKKGDFNGQMSFAIASLGNKKIETYDTLDRVSSMEKQAPSAPITYSYDGIGRMTKAISSDGTIHYEYFYEAGKEPTRLIDRVHDLQWERTYNRFGQVLEERAPFNINISWEYDALGRCTKFTLPDRSSIAYAYSGAHLSAVQRISPQNELLYEHLYTAFDPNGHIYKEELIFDIGTIKTEYDLLERPFSQNSYYMHHNVSYGPSGLVTAVRNCLIGDKSYHYDALGQLIRETDSPETDYHYSYDALGRLLSIKDNEREITYQYDPLSRLFSKKITTVREEQQQHYLYDKETEIGTISPSGVIQELKILGQTTAIALERQGQVFAPLHDFEGNTIAIITPTGKIAETYPTK